MLNFSTLLLPIYLIKYTYLTMPDATFHYLHFFSILLSLSIINWIITLIWNKKNKGYVDYIFLIVIVLQFISLILMLFPFLGIGKMYVFNNMSYYTTNHPLNIIYLSISFLTNGFLIYLRIFILYENKNMRFAGLLLIIPFVIFSSINLLRLFNFNPNNLNLIPNNNDLKFVLYFFLYSLICEIVSLFFLIFIIYKEKNNYKIVIAKVFLFFSLFTLLTMILSNIFYLFLEQIPALKFLFSFFSIYLIFINIIFSVLIISFTQKYQIISYLSLVSKLIQSSFIFCLITAIFYMINYFLSNSNAYSRHIIYLLNSFFVFFVISYSGKIRNKFEFLLEDIIFHKKKRIINELLITAESILNVLDLLELKNIVVNNIINKLEINEYAFFILKEMDQDYNLISYGKSKPDKIIKHGDSLFNNILDNNEICINDTYIFFIYHISIPILFRNRILGYLFLEHLGKIEYDGCVEDTFKRISINIGICLENINLNNKIIESRTEMLNQENIILKNMISGKNSSDKIIGQSQSIRNIINIVNRVAKSDTSILITGENGTGKELIARKIHQESDRNNLPFIAINSAAIPENLLESELFGYKKGAFSGAISDKKGILQSVNGGTIFFDEIGELPLNMQAKLLRVLQDKRITPIGSNEEIELDFRLISATNRNLPDLIQKYLFREDLFYRINVFNIKVPPLRERKEDIPILINTFILKFNLKHNKNIEGIEKKCFDYLINYNFPGNIRQLENIIEYSLVIADDDFIKMANLPEDIKINISGNNDNNVFDEKISIYEKQLIIDALIKNQNNRVNTAKYLNIDRNKLNYLIRKYNL